MFGHSGSGSNQPAPDPPDGERRQGGAQRDQHAELPPLQGPEFRAGYVDRLQTEVLLRQPPGARITVAGCLRTALGQVRGLVNSAPVEVITVLVYGSDIPFPSPACAMIMTGRLAIEAGLSVDQVRAVMGGQLDRLVSHQDPLDVGSAPAEVADLAPELERLYVTLLTSVEPMLRGEDPGQGLELAQAAAENPVGPHSEVIECIAALLQLNERKSDPDPLRSSRSPGFDLVQMAAVAARTPRATSPSQARIKQLTGVG